MQRSTVGRGGRSRLNTIYLAVGVVVVTAGWQILSMVMHEVIVASPQATLITLARLVREGVVTREVFATLQRLILGLTLAGAIGFGLGIISGLKPRFRAFLEPLRWAGMALPAVVIAVLAMLWFGMGTRQVIFVVVVVITPLIYVSTVEGIVSVDERIIEMAQVYRFSRRLLLTQVYFPAIGPAVLAGLTLATGVGIRAVVLAELLGAHDGIGHGFSRASRFLNAPEMFAWILVCLVLMGLLEFGFLAPVRRQLTRWKEEQR
ncbi:MAG: ABC transporter permease [Dehalococcoidia bacterium]|nr:putative aliphatic sulfonates transport permease protein SsuC [Chloroflexota bacterium]